VGGQIRTCGGCLSSLCGRGTGVGFCGDELAGGGCARGGEVRGGVDPVLVRVGTGSLRGEWTKGDPSHGASWFGADGFCFPFFFHASGGGARRLDVLLAPNVRTLAVPKKYNSHFLRS